MSFSLAINLPETERLDIASFVVGSNKSLASQVGYGGGGGGEIGEMELKLMLNSGQRDFYGVIWRCFARVKRESIMSGFRKCWGCR